MHGKMIVSNISIFAILCAIVIWSFGGNWQSMVSCLGSVASIQRVVIGLCEYERVRSSNNRSEMTLDEMLIDISKIS